MLSYSNVEHPCVKYRVTAVDGHYQIGIYSVRKIANGEEITFDYNSVTEVCLLLLSFHFMYHPLVTI